MEHFTIIFPLQTFRHHGAACPEAVHNRLTINGMGHGAANARVTQLRVVLVKHRETVIENRSALYFIGTVTLNAADLIGRHITRELIFAGKQTIKPGRNFRHFHKTDLAQRRTPTPILIMGHERKRHIGTEFRDHIGSGRDWLARPIKPASRFHEATPRTDVASIARKPAFQGDIRRPIDEAHRVAIQHFNLLKRRPDAA